MSEEIKPYGMVATIPALKTPCARCGGPLGRIHHTYGDDVYCSWACVPRPPSVEERLATLEAMLDALIAGLYRKGSL